MQKTITLDGQDYKLATITVAAARDAKFRAKSGLDFNIALIAASLQSGGDSTATEETVGALPFFGVFPELLNAAIEVNGLKSTTGESQPEGPADSTSITSTAA